MSRFKRRCPRKVGLCVCACGWVGGGTQAAAAACSSVQPWMPGRAAVERTPSARRPRSPPPPRPCHRLCAPSHQRGPALPRPLRQRQRQRRQHQRRRQRARRGSPDEAPQGLWLHGEAACLGVCLGALLCMGFALHALLCQAGGRGRRRGGEKEVVAGKWGRRPPGTDPHHTCLCCLGLFLSRSRPLK